MHFYLKKNIWECRLENGGQFVSASMFKYEHQSEFRTSYGGIIHRKLHMSHLSKIRNSGEIYIDG